MSSGHDDYVIRYAWNWRSAAAIGTSLGSLVLPMPPWMRILAARGMLARTALQVDALGIAGNCTPLTGEPGGRCPWADITHVVTWKFNYLTIVAIARTGDAAASMPAGMPIAGGHGSRDSQHARRPRKTRRSGHKPRRRPDARPRPPSFPLLMTPDGLPSGARNVVAATGWDVNVGLLTAAVGRFAPHVDIVDLTSHLWLPPDFDPAPDPAYYPGKDISDALEYLASLYEILRLPARKLLWALGVALSVYVMARAGGHLGSASGSHGRGTWTAELAAGGLVFLLLAGRWLLVWRRRLRSWRASAWP